MNELGFARRPFVLRHRVGQVAQKGEGDLIADEKHHSVCAPFVLIPKNDRHVAGFGDDLGMKPRAQPTDGIPNARRRDFAKAGMIDQSSQCFVAPQIRFDSSRPLVGMFVKKRVRVVGIVAAKIG